MSKNRWLMIAAGAAACGALALTWAGCGAERPAPTEKPTDPKAALASAAPEEWKAYEAAEAALAIAAPEEWKRYVERRKAAEAREAWLASAAPENWKEYIERRKAAYEADAAWGWDEELEAESRKAFAALENKAPVEYKAYRAAQEAARQAAKADQDTKDAWAKVEAAAPVEAAALKATLAKTSLMQAALRRAVEAQTARKTLSIAAPTEWAVYQAAVEALKRAAPEKWKAWETTAPKWDGTLVEALLEKPSAPKAAARTVPPRRPPAVEANALEKRWAHEAAEAARAVAPEEWKAYEAAEAALAVAAPEVWKRYVERRKAAYLMVAAPEEERRYIKRLKAAYLGDAPVDYDWDEYLSAELRKAAKADQDVQDARAKVEAAAPVEAAAIKALMGKISLRMAARKARKTLSTAAPNEWAVYQAAVEALKRTAPEAWKAWEAHRAALW